MSDTDIVEHWLLGINDGGGNEAAQAVQDSVEAEDNDTEQQPCQTTTRVLAVVEAVMSQQISADVESLEVETEAVVAIADTVTGAPAFVRQLSTDTGTGEIHDTVGELATLFNTQHNSDPKFTAEGDVLRRRHRRVSGDIFRPVQETNNFLLFILVSCFGVLDLSFFVDGSGNLERIRHPLKCLPLPCRKIILNVQHLHSNVLKAIILENLKKICQYF
jgi:hypothetical protein